MSEKDKIDTEPATSRTHSLVVGTALAAIFLVLNALLAWNHFANNEPRSTFTDRVNTACKPAYLIADFYSEGDVVRVRCEARDVSHEPFAYSVAVER